MDNRELYSVIVADDEEELREAVCRMIPWEDLGFRLLGSAGNGLDALQMVENLQPDLLLTDIHMPFIFGTSLARQVRELQPMIQVAFLSGYDDFQYAKEGIDNQVIAYLLKPISMEKLSNALTEIHSKMEQRFRDLACNDSHDSSLSVAVASLLLDSYAEPVEETELHAILSEKGLFVTAPYQLTVLAIRIAHSLLESAAHTTDKVLRRYYSCCSIVSGGRILTLIAAEDGFIRLGQALDELQQVLSRLKDPLCAIGVSRSVSRFSLCREACREAVDVLKANRESGIHHMQEMLRKTGGSFPETRDIDATLVKLFSSPERKELEQYLEQMLALADADPQQGVLTLLQLLLAARNAIASLLPEAEATTLFQRFDLLNPFAYGSDLQSLHHRTRELCMAAHGLISALGQSDVAQLCTRALRIIEQNYMKEDLSLASVSEQLHVSPNYLSANMRKYAGDTFMNLLIKARMEAAYALIRTGGLKTAQVAQRCGYTDQHYFSFCFKKYYGMSPTQLRRGEKGGPS